MYIHSFNLEWSEFFNIVHGVLYQLTWCALESSNLGACASCVNASRNSWCKRANHHSKPKYIRDVRQRAFSQTNHQCKCLFSSHKSLHCCSLSQLLAPHYCHVIIQNNYGVNNAHLEFNNNYYIFNDYANFINSRDTYLWFTYTWIP